MRLSEYLSEAVARRMTGKYSKKIEFKDCMPMDSAIRMLEDCGFKRFGPEKPDRINVQHIKDMVKEKGLRYCIARSPIYPLFDMDISTGDGSYIYEVYFSCDSKQLTKNDAIVYVYTKTGNYFSPVGENDKEWLNDFLNCELRLDEAVANKRTGKYTDKLFTKGMKETYEDTIYKLKRYGAERLVTGNVDIGKKSYTTHLLCSDYSRNTDPEKIYYAEIRKYGMKVIMLIGRADYSGDEPNRRDVCFLVYSNYNPDTLENESVLSEALLYRFYYGGTGGVNLVHGTNESPEDFIDEINRIAEK